MLSEDEILDYIFNPGLQDAGIDGRGRHVPGKDIDEMKPSQYDIDPSTLTRIHTLEAEGIQKGAMNELDHAIQCFTTCISLYDGYASAYNNRAQCYTLQKNFDLAMADLDRAVELATASHHKDVAIQAYTQRAMLHKLQDRDDKALADFDAAAKLGSLFARKECVRLNPYAAMCNNMLEHALRTQTTQSACVTAHDTATVIPSSSSPSHSDSSSSSSSLSSSSSSSSHPIS